MAQSTDQCPNCGATLKGGLIGSNSILSEKKTKSINFYHTPKSTAYCSKCGNALYERYQNMRRDEVKELYSSILSIIDHVPIVTTHTPYGWEFDVKGIVTGQSVAGTGITAELSSSFNDLFGTQSGSLTNKLKAGETLCMNQLRKRALDLGGNAVIATDVDYSEIGALKGMLMVCMAGTAVRIRNVEVLGKKQIEIITKITALNDRLIQVIDLEVD